MAVMVSADDACGVAALIRAVPRMTTWQEFAEFVIPLCSRSCVFGPSSILGTVSASHDHGTLD